MRGALADAAAANHIARPMRKDMAKVIVERPRLGRAAAGLRPGRMRPLVDDDGEIVRAKGAREPVGRAQKTKGLNETLNPLRRYLESQVGRPWNKVYSEISAHLKPTSTVQQHVRDHIEDFVAFRTRMREGQVYVNHRWGQEKLLAQSWQRLYVHPRTGLLRRNEKRPARGRMARDLRKSSAAERAARLREIDAKTQAHLFGDDWWEVKLAEVEWVRCKDESGRMQTYPKLYVDVVHRAGLSTLPGEKLYGRAGVYAAEKRQLSKAEIKRLV